MSEFVRFLVTSELSSLACPKCQAVSWGRLLLKTGLKNNAFTWKKHINSDYFFGVWRSKRIDLICSFQEICSITKNVNPKKVYFWHRKKQKQHMFPVFSPAKNDLYISCTSLPRGQRMKKNWTTLQASQRQVCQSSMCLSSKCADLDNHVTISYPEFWHKKMPKRNLQNSTMLLEAIKALVYQQWILSCPLKFLNTLFL